MSGGIVQLALREMQRHFRDPRVLVSMAVVAGILGFSGPFGTFAILPTVPRVIYWAAVVVGTYAVGFAVAATLGRVVRDRFAQRWVRVLLTGLVIGPPVTAVVIVANLLTFGAGGWAVIDPWLLLVNVTLVGIGVTAISEIVGDLARPPPAVADAAPAPPAILARIPVHLRGPLVSLSVQDHYVEVTTAKGKTLVLMRLTDAMREVGSTRGVQVHRSHWVALDAVARVERGGGKASVVLTDGRTVPVSRGYMDDAKAAGLLV